MIFLFPDYDTLKLALTSGVVPPEVSLQPASAGVDEQGRPWLEPTVHVPKSMASQLGRIGVAVPTSYPSPGEHIDTWLQALPLERETKPAEVGSGTPVIFELPDATHLPEIVGEMLRLSVDRQSFRWLRDQEGANAGVLLRVIGPPYYTLLRAIDRDTTGRASAVRAYAEKAPRVWVEIGYTHPLIDRLAPDEGQTVLLRAPREWVFLNDAPFREIYEILDFKLPRAKLDWQAAELRKRLIVPLRLIDGDRQDVELWVLRDKPIEQLDALVRDAKESLVQRLIFAVGEHDGRPLVVLRVRPSKQPPPQLVLEAEACSRYLKLDNLFVPAGTKIHPVLRRDAIRRLLAEDPAVVNWLRADPNRRGGFIPESLPDDSFHPLQDWVDYVLDRDRQSLTHWVEEFKFDFDPFVCVEEQEATPKSPRSSRRRGGGEPGHDTSERAAKTRAALPKERDDDRPVPKRDDFADVEVLAPNRLQSELAELEKSFLEIEGPLDDPQRLRLWPEMAVRRTALKQDADAGICWMNLLWELLDLDVELADLRRDTDEARQSARQARLERLQELLDHFGGEEELAWQWLRSEKGVSEWRLQSSDLDRLLENESPPFHEVRGLVACLVWGVRNEAAARVILQRLPRVMQYLERNEKFMGLRPVWLGWHAVAKLSRDALVLARARDRLIERLVNEGYSAERDLPQFLKVAGQKEGDRLNVIKSHMARLHVLALEWCARSQVGDIQGPKNVRMTSGSYVDLIFSFGLARLGEVTRCRELLNAAKATIAAEAVSQGKAEHFHEVQDFLLQCYEYRIRQALENRPHIGPLPVDLRARLERTLPNVSGSTARYSVDRLREQSRILEPQEMFHPYRDYMVSHRTDSDELDKRLSKLSEIKDPHQLSSSIYHLLKSGAGTPPTGVDQATVLADGLMLAPRVGESFVLELLTRVDVVLDRLPADRVAVATDSAKLFRAIAALLDRAMLMAANYDRIDTMQSLWPRFVQLLQQSQQSKASSSHVNCLFDQCLRSMRKLGLRDDIGTMIEQADRLLRNGRSINALQEASGTNWVELLTTLVYLAGGWLFFGWLDRAEPVLRAAREVLYNTESQDAKKDGLKPQAYVRLAVAYVTVLGHAPVEIAVLRIEELFQKMRPLKDVFLTQRYYAWLHLNIIEAVVLAIVSEDFAMGPGARKWMDDDEYLIRRRLHRDHRAMLAGA